MPPEGLHRPGRGQVRRDRRVGRPALDAQALPSARRLDEFYAFEAQPGLYQLPPLHKLEKQLRRAGMAAERARYFHRRHFFFQAFAGARSNTSTSPPTIGVSDLLTTMLQLQPADAVVIKMDAEGSEYEIVDTLLGDGTTDLIDEMMLEVHYSHPEMRRLFNWCRAPRSWFSRPKLPFWCKYSLEDATTMYQSLRDAQVYVHTWP